MILAKFIRTPKEKMATALTILSLLAILQNPSADIVIRLTLFFLAMFFFEFVFWKLRALTPFRPTAGAVSALIIFLLADPQAPLALGLLALAVAIGEKQFLRPGGNHIFNPAAAGLFAASLFGLPITWWGIGSDYLSLALTILLTGYVSVYVVRQYRVVIPFLAATLLVGSATQLLVGSFWFFALVMLPEPMTAAHYPKTRLLYGVLVAVLSLAIPLSGIFLEPLVTALLLGNLFAWAVERNFKQ